MKGTKVIGGVLVVAGLGIAGYFGYKLYSQTKGAPVVSGLGAFVDGNFVDHNALIAHKYWAHQRGLELERRRLQAMGR